MVRRGLHLVLLVLGVPIPMEEKEEEEEGMDMEWENKKRLQRSLKRIGGRSTVSNPFTGNVALDVKKNLTRVLSLLSNTLPLPNRGL